MSGRGPTLYRWLLRLLPGAFHYRHATEIEQTLAEESDRVGAAGGPTARRFWFRAIVDLVAGALSEWCRDLYRDSLHDIRYGVRSLLRSPGFTVLATVALALGLGANVAVFTLVNEVAFRPLPVHEPERLVNILVDQPGSNSFSGFSYPEYIDYRDRNRVLDGVATTSGISLTLDSGASASGQLVSADYFDVLGISPVMGRALTPEDHDDVATVAVASHGFWQRNGAQDDFVGSSISARGLTLTIIGVLPEDFSGIFIGFPSDLFVPLSLMDQLRPGTQLASRQDQSLEMFGRLSPGISIDAAELSLDALAAEFEVVFPEAYRARRIHMYPLTGIDHALRAGVTAFVVILLALSFLVLLAACLNVGGMLLARGEYRRREIAIRAAIGASRGRIVRQLVTETLALFAVGATAALVVALQVNGLLRGVVDALPVPLGFELHIDGRVLAFAAGVSLITALFTGVLPALRASPSRPGHGGGRHSGSQKVRNILLVAQVAVSLVLLMTAGLFLRAAQAGQHLDTGFDLDALDAVGFGLPAERYSETQALNFYQQLVSGLAARHPEVLVSFAEMPPIGVAHSPQQVTIPGYDPPADDSGIAVDINAVGDAYFQTVGIPLVAGAGFGTADRTDGQRVAVVNRAMAERFWPAQSAIGRVVRDGESEVRIIGVVENTRHVIQDPVPAPMMYVPASQRPVRRMVVLARAPNGVATLGETLGSVATRLDAALPPAVFQPAAGTIDFFLLPQRVAGRLVGGLGVLALLLAIAGVYGAVSYSVGRRQRELGIRVALGGAPRAQLALVMRGGLLLVTIGIALGVATVAALAPLLGSFLFEVNAFDPAVVAATTGTLLLAALAAIYLPARRVLRLDAIEVLRGD